MKSAPILGGLATVIAISWTAYAMRTSPSPEPIHISPATHTAYNAASIDRNIEFHQQRVKRDPGGAIGWAMLAEAWLARSRESDLDSAAWQAEAAARKSIALRFDGNSRGKGTLVESLLEQHRFQDALSALNTFKFKTRHTADVLVEMGRLDEATKILDTLPFQKEDPSLLATRSLIALHQGNSLMAQGFLEGGLKLCEANPGVSETTIAWFKTKLANVHVVRGEYAEASDLLNSALIQNPRSYKAHLALAGVAAKEKNWNDVIVHAKRTLEIADSLDAKALIADAQKALGKDAEAQKTIEACHDQYLKEVKLFDSLGKGGALHVKPIDRQFATFAAAHRVYVQDGLAAAKRDFQNRPDDTAHKNLEMLTKLATAERKAK